MTPGMKHFLMANYKLTSEQLRETRIAEIERKKRIRAREKQLGQTNLPKTS